MNATSSLGTVLYRYRVEAALTQEELARRAGIGVRTLRDIEQGRVSAPQPRSVRRLAKALGVPAVTVEELLTTIRPRAGQMDGELSVRILGPLAVSRGRVSVEIRSKMQRTLLGMLALHADDAVPYDDIVDTLWGDRPPRTCLSLVQGYVGGLRTLLEPDRHTRTSGRVIATVRRGYRLELDVCRVDVQRFDNLAGMARQAQQVGNLSTALDLFGQALECWRGQLLADDGPEARLQHLPTAAALGRRRLSVTLAAADLAMRLDHPRRATDWLRDLAPEEQLHEALYARLMLALAGCGQQAEALRLYTDLRTRLADDLGVEPGAELQDAYLRVLRQQVPTTRTGPVRTGPGPGPALPNEQAASSLPADTVGFTGRHAQLRQLDALLESAGEHPTAAVITAIGGCAGIGKTTLAVHWAHRVRERFPDGQLYLNLRGFDPGGRPVPPSDALRALLELLAVPADQIPASVDALAGRYRGRLAGKRMLVVLDNARDAGQVRPLLPGSPHCLVLVTSRNQLTGLVAADGAELVALDALGDDEARQLLANRLGAERVAAEPEAVNGIVGACAGLPLALAIVAARAVAQPGFPLTVFAGELADAQGRLDALAGSDTATDARAVFSWSYQALAPPAAQLFRLLGLHPGPQIGLGAAASLAAAPIPQTRRLLAELTGAHLLTEHLPGRYASHDLLRAYAGERARATDPEPSRRAAIHRLLDHYLHTSDHAARLLNPHRIPRRLPDPQPGVAAEALDGHDDALAWLTDEHQAILATFTRPDGTDFDSHVCHLAWTLAELLDRRGSWHDQLTAQRAALDAARRLGDLERQAFSHRAIGSACLQLHRLPDAHLHLRHALDLYRQLADEFGQAATHISLGRALERQRRYREALDHAEQALALYRSMGRRRGQAGALNGIGWLHAKLGDYQQTLIHCRQALLLHQELGPSTGEADTWDSLGVAHHHLGQPERAIACFERAGQLYRTLGNRYHEADSASRLGDVQRAVGDQAAARRCWQRALEIFDEIGHPDAGRVRARLRDGDAPPAA